MPCFTKSFSAHIVECEPLSHAINTIFASRTFISKEQGTSALNGSLSI